MGLRPGTVKPPDPNASLDAASPDPQAIGALMRRATAETSTRPIRHRPEVACVDDTDAEHEPETLAGEIPEGVGPEIFREHLTKAAKQDPAHGVNIRLNDNTVFLEDIESVEAEPDEHRSRVRLRNGIIIGGLTGAAIAAALATLRYRRRRQ